MSGRQLRLLRVDELAVHAWDVARAIGAGDRLDPTLATWLYEKMKAIESFLVDSGMYRAPGDGPKTDDAQQRLLHLLGRQ